MNPIAKFARLNKFGVRNTQMIARALNLNTREAGPRWALGRIIEQALFLIEYGADIKVTERGFSLDIEPLMQKNIALNFDKFNANEIANILELIRYGIKYGAVVVVIGNGMDRSKGIATIARDKALIIDINKKILTTNYGIKFYISLIEPWIIIETFYLKIHEVQNLKGKVIFDVGAAFGDTALYFAKCGARVFSVEPNPVNYSAMMENIKLNPELKGKITTANCAVGNNGKIKFNYFAGGVHGGGSSFSTYEKGNRVAEVNSFTLPSLMKIFKVKNIDYLKMDAKGAEFLMKYGDLADVSMLKLEYAARDKKQIFDLLSLLNESGFNYSVVMHSPECITDLKLIGTIYAERKRKRIITC